jgi:hypothetical protein
MKVQLMTNMEVRKQIADFIRSHPAMAYREIAQVLECSITTLSSIAQEFKCPRQKGRPRLTEADLKKLDAYQTGESK